MTQRFAYELQQALDDYGEACAAIDTLPSDEYWNRRQAARDALDAALAAALSGEPPAPTPEPSCEDGIICGPWIRCGDFHHDADINQNLEDAAAEVPGSTRDGGCRRPGRLSLMYRCVECSRWFHRECAKSHFLATAVPPAAPTAATPDPREDPTLRDAIQRWLGSVNHIPEREAEMYAAISDWHRRTLGGEPAPEIRRWILATKELARWTSGAMEEDGWWFEDDEALIAAVTAMVKDQRVAILEVKEDG